MTYAPPLAASLVAKWFIERAQRAPDHDLDNLKLQKLLYLAQSRFLYLSGTSLIREEFSAWKHGPVVAPLWKECSEFKDGPIHMDLAEDGPWHHLRRDVEIVLDETWMAFGVYSGWRLRDITHEVGPWSEVFVDDVRNIVIPRDAIGAAWAEFAKLEAEPAVAHNAVEDALEQFRLLAARTPEGTRRGDPAVLESELARTDALRKEANTLLQ